MIFLEWPWRLVVIVPLALFECLEVALWLKLRRARALTGAEAMVGMKGLALTNCEPDGQVRVKGQTWRAHCAGGVGAGEEVVVVRMDGIRLEVARAEGVGPSDRSA